jgi:transcriptional regulator with XRE-family HTH domain
LEKSWIFLLSQRLEYVRKELKLNKGQLAQAMQTTQKSLTGYLKGEYEPKASSLAALCESQKVSAQWLLLGQGPMFIEKNYQDNASGWAHQVKEAVDGYTHGLAPISQIYAAVRHTVADYVSAEETRLVHKMILRAEQETDATETHQQAARELYELKATLEDLDEMDPMDKKTLYRHVLNKYYGSGDAIGSIKSIAKEEPNRRASDDQEQGS